MFGVRVQREAAIVNGSARLTPEQQQWYRDKFGVVYLNVPDMPWSLPRKDRRKRKFRPRSER